MSLLSDDVELIEQNSQTFQIGRTVVTLKAKSTQPWKSKDKTSGKSVTEAMFKDPNIKDRFLQGSQALMNNHANSPSGHRNDKIQNVVPVANKRGPEGADGHQQIIEIDGKRYLVIQELDPPIHGMNNNDEYNEESDN